MHIDRLEATARESAKKLLQHKEKFKKLTGCPLGKLSLVQLKVSLLSVL